eukprot:3208451-Prymnesium_polylepis.1
MQERYDGARGERVLFLDASRHLGRPAGKGDLVGAEYGVPPSQCKGGKDAVKLSSVTVPGSATRLPSPTDLDSSVASPVAILCGGMLCFDPHCLL